MINIQALVGVLCFVVVAGDHLKPNSCKLSQLITLFRHGSRSPVVHIPGDKYNSIWDKTCLGELTNVGKYEQFLNGKLTKDIYGNFLGNSYKCSEFYIQSSLYPRAVMSGDSFLAGLFKPTENETWTTKEDIGRVWQPIPLFSTNIAADSTLMNNSFVIPSGSDVLDSELYSQPKIRRAMEAIANATGINDYINNFSNLFYYVDTLMCEAYLGYSLPFELQQYKDDLKPIMNFVMSEGISEAYSVTAAILLNDMSKRIGAYKAKSSTVKTNMYSLHDLHVAVLMKALTGEYIGEPPFSSTIYLELCDADEHVHADYVRLWYRPSVYSEPTSYSITGCGQNCPYSKFQELVGVINQQSEGVTGKS